MLKPLVIGANRLSPLHTEACRRLGCIPHLDNGSLYLCWPSLGKLDRLHPSRQGLLPMLAGAMGAEMLHLCSRIVRNNGETKGTDPVVWRVHSSFVREGEKWTFLEPPDDDGYAHLIAID